VSQDKKAQLWLQHTDLLDDAVGSPWVRQIRMLPVGHVALL